ncbi:MAG: glycosyltransferase [bacterium]
MAKIKPFFSIIIPTLNEEKYLPLLLDDLSHQTFRDFEVIVVDGHSSDQTVFQTKTFISKLPSLKIINSPKRHVCVQRNLGASHARADILIFSDADNRLPSYFLQGIKYRWESSAVDVLSLHIRPDVITPQNETIANALNLFFDLQKPTKPRYLLESLIIISKSAFNSIGGFNASINYAEGKSFIQNITNLGYSSKIIKDPQYTFSFRRLRKFGIMNMANRVAKLELAELLGSEFNTYQTKRLYPMVGGTIFNKPKRVKNKFLKNITQLLKDF